MCVCACLCTWILDVWIPYVDFVCAGLCTLIPVILPVSRDTNMGVSPRYCTEVTKDLGPIVLPSSPDIRSMAMRAHDLFCGYACARPGHYPFVFWLACDGLLAIECVCVTRDVQLYVSHENIYMGLFASSRQTSCAQMCLRGSSCTVSATKTCTWVELRVCVIYCL